VSGQTSFVPGDTSLAVSDVPRAVAFFTDVLETREFTILDPDRNAVTFFDGT
jgi:catechol 2,3-dioxygenase-like lactoylglutathione lyase family enzyme